MSASDRRFRRLRERSDGPRIEVDAPIRVGVLTPAGDHVTTEYASSMHHMLLHLWEAKDPRFESIGVYTYGSSILPFSRQVLAQMAIEHQCTHTLWIDSDMSFPKDILNRFAGRSEKIIGINAMGRRPPFRTTAQSAPGVNIDTTPESTGLQKVSRIGFGVAWVATEVFTRMKKPWFEFTWVEEFGCFRGEDYLFCDRAKDLGYEIHIDQDLSKLVHHIGAFNYNPMLRTITKQFDPGDGPLPSTPITKA